MTGLLTRWRYRCPGCGGTDSWWGLPYLRVGPVSWGKRRLRWCKACRRLRWSVAEPVPDQV